MYSGKGSVLDLLAKDLFQMSPLFLQWINHRHPLTYIDKILNSLIPACHTLKIFKKCASWISITCTSNWYTSWVCLVCDMPDRIKLLKVYNGSMGSMIFHCKMEELHVINTNLRIDPKPILYPVY